MPDARCLSGLRALYIHVVKRDGVYNPVTHVSKAIEPSNRFDRGYKPRPALENRIDLSENDALHYRSSSYKRSGLLLNLN